MYTSMKEQLVNARRKGKLPPEEPKDKALRLYQEFRDAKKDYHNSYLRFNPNGFFVPKEHYPPKLTNKRLRMERLKEILTDHCGRFGISLPDLD